MEEPEEQCTVVFALIVTEPASECVGVGGGCYTPPLTSRFRNSLWKDDSALFFLDFSMLPTTRKMNSWSVMAEQNWFSYDVKNIIKINITSFIFWTTVYM